MLHESYWQVRPSVLQPLGWTMNRTNWTLSLSLTLVQKSFVIIDHQWTLIIINSWSCVLTVTVGLRQYNQCGRWKVLRPKRWWTLTWDYSSHLDIRVYMSQFQKMFPPDRHRAGQSRLPSLLEGDRLHGHRFGNCKTKTRDPNLHQRTQVLQGLNMWRIITNFK